MNVFTLLTRLRQLSDIILTSNAAGDVLYFDGSNWVNLNKDVGKYLKSGNAAVSWDTPTIGDAGNSQAIILPSDYTTIGQGTWVVFVSTTKFLNGCFLSGGTNGDNVNFKVYLMAGTYTLNYFCFTNANVCISTVAIDGVDKASFDLYSVGAVDNVIKTQAGITVSTSGIKTINVRANSKNVSSSGYQNNFAYMTFYRTA